MVTQEPSPEARAYFDDREAFETAEAALAVIVRRCPQFPDEEAAWEGFIRWRGPAEADYLRRIRAVRKYIFCAVLQDLYDFAARVCGENVTPEIGRELSGRLLDRSLPDVLEVTLAHSGNLREQVTWLIDRLVSAATGSVYRLDFDWDEPASTLRIRVGYRFPDEMAAYLKKAGHSPERAFANSFEVFGGVQALMERTVHGMDAGQIERRLYSLHGEFLLRLTDRNRFHYENIIDLLLTYVRRLGERKSREPDAAAGVTAPSGSAAMAAALDGIRKAAACDETVLLCGESGTGKSYYARHIHQTGARRDGPFVEVGITADVGSENLVQSNLFGHVRGAFTGAEDEKQGLFALADGGTIFLDEIGDASPEVQAKLLRVIESKTFRMLGGLHDISADVRILAATNRDLEALVREGRFRQDLFYRLNVIRVELPPLRERAGDVPGLVQVLLRKVCAEAGRQEKVLSAGAFEALCAYGWPGNIRELENALRRAVAFCEGVEIGLADLPATIGQAGRPAVGGEAVASVVDEDSLERALSSGPPPAATPTSAWPAHVDYARRRYLSALIRHYHGNLARIAEHWDRSSENTLRKTVRQFGLEDELRRAREERQ
jgi:DNA-binding NtrC family response regulator